MEQMHVKAVVLAAGKGTRMQSEANHLPKVLRQALGRPLLSYVLDALAFIPEEDTVLVTGFMHGAVEAAFPGYPAVLQEPQKGTGHAVQCAAPELEGFDGTVLVCYGDMPLLRRETYQALLRCHAETGAACTLLAGTSEMDLPYGRVIRDENGDFVAVVEDRDCTPEQKRIRELNMGIYAFDCRKLLAALDQLEPVNAQHEYYLTDVPGILRAGGERVAVYVRDLGAQILGINTPEQLRLAEQFLRERE